MRDIIYKFLQPTDRPAEKGATWLSVRLVLSSAAIGCDKKDIITQRFVSHARIPLSKDRSPNIPRRKNCL